MIGAGAGNEASSSSLSSGRCGAETKKGVCNNPLSGLSALKGAIAGQDGSKFGSKFHSSAASPTLGTPESGPESESASGEDGSGGFPSASGVDPETGAMWSGG